MQRNEPRATEAEDERRMVIMKQCCTEQLPMMNWGVGKVAEDLVKVGESKNPGLRDVIPSGTAENVIHHSIS